MLSEVGPVVLVGAGKMGMAMADGWLDAGLSPDRLILVDPNPSSAVRNKASTVGLTVYQSVPNKDAQVILLAVKPQVADEVLASIKPAIGDQTVLISVMAGISISKMEKLSGCAKVIRAMPNTPAQIGKGITGVFSNKAVDPQDRMVADNLLEASGDVVWLNEEDDINKVTGVAGSGPAYVFHMVEALAEAAEANGMTPEMAMRFARQTIVGAASLLEYDSQTSAAQLRENVTSPNGTTYAGLQVLMAEDGLVPLMEKTVKAATARARELGEDE